MATTTIKDRRILKLLKTFNKKELNQLLLFTHQHKNVKDKNLPIIIAQFITNAPKFDHPSLSNAQLKLQYKHKKYPAGKYLNYLMNWSVELIEEYLVQQQLKTDASLYKQTLLAALVNRGLENPAKKVTQQIEKTINKNNNQSYDYYLQSSKLNEQLSNYQQKHEQRKFNAHLQSAAKDLDDFYQIKKLRYACEMATQESVFGWEYEMNHLSELLQTIAKSIDQTQPALLVYYYMFLSITKPNEIDHFKNLKKTLSQHNHLLPFNEARDAYLTSVNYCIKKINSGQSDFGSELLDIYEGALQRELIFENGYLSPWSYKNIVTLALRNGSFDWAINFIEDYKNKMKTSYRVNAYNYNLANYHFHQGNFEDAQAQLLNVTFTDLYYNLDSRQLLLKIYFELDEVDALYAMIASFRTSLNRNSKVSDYMRTTYSNFTKYLRRTFDYFDKKKLKELKTKLANEKIVADRKWLNEKIDEQL